MSGAVTARQLMTAPAMTVSADATVAGAARLMARGHLKRLPVVDAEGRLVGVPRLGPAGPRPGLLAMRRHAARDTLGVQRRCAGTVITMRAHLGDRLVVESPTTGATRRDGEIVGLHHSDGTPPYDVRWSDTNEVTLVFPGPDAHIHHVEHGPEGRPAHEAHNPGDIGRRVALERKRLGLTRTETARRARMAPEYLAYLEEHPADPSLASLIRLADTLGTTVAALRGGGRDRPPGLGQAAPPPSAARPRRRRMPHTAFHTRRRPRRRIDARWPGGHPCELRGRR